MTATPPKPKYKTQAEILAAGLSPYQAGMELDALKKWELQNPPVPEPPLPLTTGERAELSRLKSELEKLSSDFKTLAEREKRFADELPSAVEALHKGECLPDAADEVILAEFLAERRLQKIRQFLANVSPLRELLVRDLGNAFMRLNPILERFNAQKFYPGGAVHFPAINAALAAIEKVVK